MDVSHAVPLGSDILGINVDTVPNYISFQHFDTHPFTRCKSHSPFPRSFKRNYKQRASVDQQLLKLKKLMAEQRKE